MYSATFSVAGAAAPELRAVPTRAKADLEIKIGLIGCGGRGTGAVVNALNSPHGPVELYAMADIVEELGPEDREAIFEFEQAVKYVYGTWVKKLWFMGK